MMNFISVLALICTFSWISVSFCQFHTVAVRPAEDVTLVSINFSSFPSRIWWFKLNSSPNASRISSMSTSNSNVSLEDGIHFNKYTMSSNTTNLFLKIKKVNFSDSGLYFCGTNIGENLDVFTATYLRVEDGLPKLPSVILGCIAVFLAVVIIALTVKIRNFQTGQTEQNDLQPTENLDPDNLNYAALNFRPKVKRNIRPAAEGEFGSNVVYASTK